jgi:glycosyltransferase involved in cell wall biosynthesis
MRLKIVLNTPFEGITTGWPHRCMSITRVLAQRHGVSLFCPGDTTLLQKHVPRALTCESTSGLPERRAILGGITAYHNPLRVAQAFFGARYYPDYHRLIESDDTQYDASLYFGLLAYPFYGGNDRASSIVCDVPDSFRRELDTAMANTASIRSKPSIWKKKYRYKWIRKIKQTCYPEHVRITACTEDDAEAIRTALPRHEIVAAVGGVTPLPFDESDAAVKAKWQSQEILFLGNLSFEPNVESVLFTLRRLWPSIRNRYPDLVFKIVGRSPSDKVRAAAKNTPGAVVVGPVDSVAPHYVSAKLLLAPIFSGAGIKNKFLESLSAGTPVITTSEGARGIGFENGLHGTVADSAEDLLAGAFSLVDMDTKKYHKSMVACRHLAAMHSWESTADTIEHLLENKR